MNITFKLPYPKRTLPEFLPWLAELLSKPELSETETQFEHIKVLAEDREVAAWIFAPSQTRRLSLLPNDVMVYYERYTYVDRRELIYHALVGIDCEML